MQRRTHVVVSSPIGALTIVARAGALTGLFMDCERHRFPDEALGERAVGDAEPFEETRRQLDAYFAGELREFDLPLAPDGTPFQHRVWARLREIPYGETTTYGELAQSLGKPTAFRAVGLANGRNPLSVVVPCHRVVGANGDLTGYAGGLQRKEFLLGLERAAGAA